ncbi:ferritin family protein [candidate division WOR-3 bacterium]|nr:ferritin family protein [candidate division WOR-3 bacterium]
MNQEKYSEILKMAINNEIEAYEFYIGASQKVGNSNMKSIFSDLALEEKNHRSILENHLKNSSKPLVFKEGPDYRVSESVELPPLNAEMKPSEAMALAMKKEEEAMNLYEDFAKVSADTEQAQTFINLANMEKGHKAKLEEIFTNMAFPEDW